MRNLVLAMITLSLILWRPAMVTAQPTPAVAYQQGRDHDDRDRHDDQDRHGDNDRHDDRDKDRDHDGDRTPRGSYRETCRNIHMEGDTLKATCQKRDNRGWRDTSIKHADRCREVTNDNGRLECGR